MKAAFIILTTAALAQEITGGRERALWNTAIPAPSAKTVSPSPKAPASPPGGLIGVTLWRLRKPTGQEAGVRALVHEEGRDEQMVMERLSSSTAFSEGERVRLSIEVAREGHLYVASQELYADGSKGEPVIVFPTSRIRGGDQRVKPGQPVELPGWQDQPPYWRLKRGRPNQVAELVTILVAPQPVAELRPGSRAQVIKQEVLENWKRQWGGQVTKVEAAGQAGRTYSTTEQQAAKGEVSLGGKDPVPQTLFTAASKPGSPMLIDIALRLEPKK